MFEPQIREKDGVKQIYGLVFQVPAEQLASAYRARAQEQDHASRRVCKHEGKCECEAARGLAIDAEASRFLAEHVVPGAVYYLTPNQIPSVDWSSVPILPMRSTCHGCGC